MSSLKVALYGAMLLAVMSLSGCQKIKEEIQCREVCSEIKACDSSAVSVDACQDTCFDRAEANRTFRNEVDDCANCLESEDYSCAEIEELCPACLTVSSTLLPAE